MRKLPVLAVAGVVGVAIGALFIQLGVTGSVLPSTPSVQVARGIRMCVPDPNGNPQSIFFDVHNSANGAVKLVSATAGLANVQQNDTWFLAKYPGNNSAGEGNAHLTAGQGWATRKSLAVD